MALRAKFEQNYKGVLLKSGRIYSFSYDAFHHDPTPLIVFLYWMEGSHPRTGNQWRFFQAINLNYLNRSYRQKFIKDWVTSLYTTQNLKLTWQALIRRFPDMQFATRRYLYRPASYIKSLRAVELVHVEKEVVGSLYKDYSRQAKIAFWTQLRRTQAAMPDILGGHGKY